MTCSERERAILRRLMRGATNRKIACDLDITEGAVNVHLARLFRKLGVENCSQAMTWARDTEALEGF